MVVNIYTNHILHLCNTAQDIDTLSVCTAPRNRRSTGNEFHCWNQCVFVFMWSSQTLTWMVLHLPYAQSFWSFYLQETEGCSRLPITSYLQSYSMGAKNRVSSLRLPQQRRDFSVKGEQRTDIGLALAIWVVVRWKEMACSGPLLFFITGSFPQLCHMCWQCPFIVWGYLIPISVSPSAIAQT